VFSRLREGRVRGRLILERVLNVGTFGWQPVGHASPTTGFLGNCRARTPSGLRAVRRGGLLKQALRPDGSTLVAWLKMRRVSDTADKQRVFL